ncbi:Protein CBR-LET-805 [Anopheles sinensis]|uniref:Protein CBR-LET-805 n=1 Tax=Anopheles sinensis TaxID=74873 RepID=A0A084WTR2_ANOSI|nr:Protein CBR-LET-805 [Anopheles sinensis]
MEATAVRFCTSVKNGRTAKDAATIGCFDIASHRADDTLAGITATEEDVPDRIAGTGVGESLEHEVVTFGSVGFNWDLPCVCQGGSQLTGLEDWRKSAAWWHFG